MQKNLIGVCLNLQILSQFLVTKDTKGEMELFDRMFQQVRSLHHFLFWISTVSIWNQLFPQIKLYMVPGSMFGCEKPGWFRIIFAVTPERYCHLFKRAKRSKNIFDAMWRKNTWELRHVYIYYIYLKVNIQQLALHEYDLLFSRLQEGMDRLENMLMWNNDKISFWSLDNIFTFHVDEQGTLISILAQGYKNNKMLSLIMIM